MHENWLGKGRIPYKYSLQPRGAGPAHEVSIDRSNSCLRRLNASTMASLPVSMADVEAAMTRIRDHVHYTPVMTCSYLNSLSGLQLYFKCENFQKTGAFKVW